MNNNFVNQLFYLQDKIAVITGGGGILCGTMSRALAQAGAKVVVLDLFLEPAQKVVDEIRSAIDYRSVHRYPML